MMRAIPVRRPPNSACRACRRLKMRCLRTSPSSCERCLKVGRRCVATDSSEAAPAPAPAPTPLQSRRDVTPAERALDATLSRSAGTITDLPSIYSTSPAVNHQTGSTSALLPDLEPQPCDEGDISEADAAQWLQIFRDKLLFTALIFDQADFSDSQALIRGSPNLTMCIAYVTARYVPGYHNLRVSLGARITLFMQSTWTQANQSFEQQLRDFQALIILYMFSRAVAIERFSDGTSNVDFWSIKATCEAYALRMNVHRTAERLLAHLDAGHGLQRLDDNVKLYLYWLWLFSTSHHVAIVTGTPPTITADASIRAATSLLASLKAIPAIVVIVAEAELCLLWYKLAGKDPRIKEWWCASDIRALEATDETRLQPTDIDAALASCTYPHWLERGATFDSTSVLSTTPDYYFHYTRFCLHTFLLPRPNDTGYSDADIEAVARCVDAALSVLNLSTKIGPAGKDQLRYFPGFLWVTFSYCSSFVIKALNSFPQSVPNEAAAVATLRKIAHFMIDLGLERGHSGDAFTAGQSVIGEISTTQQGHHSPSENQEPSPVPMLMRGTLDQVGQPVLQGVFDHQMLYQGYQLPAWDERFGLR